MNSKSAFILCGILLLIASLCHSQSITWEKQFHFDQWSNAGSVIETEDSGFFELTTDVSSVPNAIWLIKLNKTGNIVWEKLMDSTGGGILSLIKKSPGLYMVLVGTYIMEFNESGNILWTKYYDPLNDYEPYGLLSLDNGNYLEMAALARPGNYPSGYTPGKMLIQKFDKNHNITWSDSFNFGLQTAGSLFGGIIKTYENNILISGEVSRGGINHAYAYILILDTNGKKLNYVPYPALSDSSEQVEYVGQLKNGNLLIESCNSSFGSFFFTLADSMGNTIKRWNVGGYHNGTGGFVVDGDSVILLAAAGLVTGPLTLQKFDTAFHQIWEKQYDKPSYYFNQPQQILRTSDGGLLFTGTRSTSTYSDMVLIKVDDNGYCADEDLSGTDNPSAIAKETSVYPNPATNNLYINTVKSYANLRIDVFDSKGVKVISLPQTSPGVQNIDISKLSKGLYMYRLYNEYGLFKEGKFVKE